MTDLPTDVAQLHGDPTDRDAQRLALWPELIEAADRIVDDLPNNHNAMVFSHLLWRARELSACPAASDGG
jgi:hypothetical protein